MLIGAVDGFHSCRVFPDGWTGFSLDRIWTYLVFNGLVGRFFRIVVWTVFRRNGWFCKDSLDLDGLSSGFGFVRVPVTKMLKNQPEVKCIRRTYASARRTEARLFRAGYDFIRHILQKTL